IAPGAGQEDFRLAKKENLDLVEAIGEEANYLDGFGQFSGQNAKNHPEIIIDYLKEKDKGCFLFKVEKYCHRYPVCWRCKTELVWRLVEEWYIAMDELRPKMMAVTKKIHWLPPWGKERELDWLKNMEDWLISKKRYWGLALPIWECSCGHFEVVGSNQELKEKAVEGWDKFAGHSPHRPWLDEIKIKCPKCGQLASRIKDVGNPWLDAGIIPFSTLRYRTDKKFWSEWFPTDFITESLPGQFKNWFYSLIAMSTVLENTNPFKTVLGHGSVLGEDGQAMHKSMGNAIDFNKGAEKMGVDVMRWLFISHNPAENLLFGYKTADEVRRRFHLLLWNIYNFFISNALINQWQPRENKKISQNILDRWLLSRLHNLIKQTTASLENFDALSAAVKIEKFVNDFSTWYVRRSRDRKEDCYATFYHVLVTLAKLLAPFTPFLAEEIFKNLTDRESVHLEEWPEFEEKLIDENLEKQMEGARKICELAHAARKEAKIKVRQPLRELLITNYELKIGEDLKQLIKDELNVKNIVVKEGKGELKVSLDTKITPELKAEGEARELVRQIQDLRKKTGCRLDEKIKVAGPVWPVDKKLQDYLKKETLASELLPGRELKIVK
ncbi:class I tRNA ligase family protein, partial [Patescibacteria group bacterium]|nr:class I tRNA ligase family protein [Patescibacteria group bacterium]